LKRSSATLKSAVLYPESSAKLWSQVAQVKAEIARHLVRAPVDGEILRLTLRPGEYLVSGGAAPLLLFGEDASLYLRVDIDESDAWRIRPGAAAMAFARGSPHIRVPLRFEYIEPYIVPKTALTGQSTERSDTRVLQVLYSFDRDGEPLYAGQQMDVFIQAGPDRNGGH
jgi:HlyD family secretion protein